MTSLHLSMILFCEAKRLATKLLQMFNNDNKQFVNKWNNENEAIKLIESALLVAEQRGNETQCRLTSNH